MIKAALHERFGIIALEYNGVTPDSVRLENLSQFKNYSHPSVPLLLSGKAGGEGINIQQASIMIQTEIWWNRNAELQVYSRLLRPGQLHKVIIIRLQGKGCSIDDCIIGVQCRKKTTNTILMRPIVRPHDKPPRIPEMRFRKPFLPPSC
ncbi:hypothetical protein P3342_002751 [Pyrenophora teres f. teres]|nr:hypothetical protein P3342_002751 [Pyrenophora teres f. teres]